MSDLYDSLEPGQRVQLEKVVYDPWTKLKAGDRGTVVHTTIPSQGGRVGVYDRSDEEPVLVMELDSYRIVSVRWDNGSWLMLIPEAGDALRPLTAEEAEAETDVPDPWRPPEGAAATAVIAPPVKVGTPKTTAETEADKASAMLGAFHPGGDD